jgi:glycine cleavage system H lipoate-binding protein
MYFLESTLQLSFSSNRKKYKEGVDMKEVRKRPGKKVKDKIQGYRVLKDECIWMKGGVVNFRICDRAYDCFNCAFDKGMQRTMAGKTDGSGYKKPEWARILCEKYKGDTKPCRHYITGSISSPKTCPINYECYHCKYDQLMDELQLGTSFQEPELTNVSGYKIAEGFYYSEGHTWACYEHGGRIRVGFDDFFTKLFGPVESISFPSLGKKIKAGESGLRFEKGSHIASVLYPASGTVLTLNHDVIENPSLIHEDPYHNGWLFILEPNSAKKDNKNLYHSSECIPFLEGEIQKIHSFLGQEYEKLAATGGAPVDDLIGKNPDMGWDNIVRDFLHTGK